MQQQQLWHRACLCTGTVGQTLRPEKTQLKQVEESVMKRMLLSAVVVGALVLGGLFSGTAQAHGPHHGYGHHHHGPVCRPVVVCGGGGYYGGLYPTTVFSNRYMAPYGAGYSGGWQPYQGFYRPGPRAQIGFHFGF
jgi:hypothetical protein